MYFLTISACILIKNKLIETFGKQQIFSGKNTHLDLGFFEKKIIVIKLEFFFKEKQGIQSDVFPIVVFEVGSSGRKCFVKYHENVGEYFQKNVL
jgi:hypothetical protein